MSRIVLVHGAWHGPWCWEKVIPYLEQKGHEVSTPELPLAEGLEAYADVVADVVTDLVESANDPVVLVGHSMAGAVISLVGEKIPESVNRLVYLAAFAPLNGESINDKTRLSLASALRDSMVVGKDGNVTVNPEVVGSAFYADCDEADIEHATKRLRPQNASAFGTKLSLTEKNYGSITKHYIECVEDQAIHISLQRKMAREIGCTLINSMQTSHSPFLSAPASLAAFIAQIGINDSRI